MDLDYQRLDDISYDIDEYYYLYGIPFFLLYIRIVAVVIGHCTHNSHFPVFVAVNGLMDCFLYAAGNFFYRWPHEQRKPQFIYRFLGTRNVFISFFYFLTSLTSYSLAVSTLFMSFYMFSVVCLHKHWHVWWNNCLHRYMTVVIFIPAGLFLNILLSTSRFRYVAKEGEYFLVSNSLIPQMVNRENGLCILKICFVLTMFFLVPTLLQLIYMTVRRNSRGLEHNEWSNTIIVAVFAIGRGLFVYYQYLSSSLKAENRTEELYILGRSFPVWNDAITLSPALFMILVSKPIRRLTIPMLYWRLNRVGVDDTSKKVDVIDKDVEKNSIDTCEKAKVIDDSDSAHTSEDTPRALDQKSEKSLNEWKEAPEMESAQEPPPSDGIPAPAPEDNTGHEPQKDLKDQSN